MRVLMNGISAIKNRTGVGHTTANLHRALVEARPDDLFWLSPGEWVGHAASRVLRGPRCLGLGKRQSGPAPDRSLRGFVGTVVKGAAKAAYRSHLQTSARWGGFDLYHEPNFVAVPTTLPTIVTVHDLSVLIHPEWHPADRVRFHDQHFRRGLADAAHVLVVSESVRNECLEVLNLSADRVTTVYNGLDEQFRPQPDDVLAAYRQRTKLPESYFLAIGTIEPRKNIGTLMRAFCDLPATIRERCPLVLAGGWGWKSQPDRDYFEAEARHRGVIHLGYVEDRDLPALYGGAAALLYPSHYEGFGLPPMEMLACGGAVVASKAAAVREVLGHHAYFVEALDRDGWREAMNRVATDPEFPESLKAGGIERASFFNWPRAAARTYAVYRKVLGMDAEVEDRSCRSSHPAA